jgi:HK97 family phage prohead protease
MPSEQTDRRVVFMGAVRLEKRDGDVAKRTLAGHAALFDSPYMIGPESWGFEEQIKRGAFAKSLSRGDDVRALWNHDANHVLGRSKSGTLTLEEDDEGLAFDLTPPDTQLGRDLVVLVERGDVSQMSFAFRAVKEEWDFSGKVDRRTLLEVDLFDVSPVTYPANAATDIALRSAASILEGRRQERARAASRDLHLRLLEIDANP